LCAQVEQSVMALQFDCANGNRLQGVPDSLLFSAGYDRA
jgi:hypothetical protein